MTAVRPFPAAWLQAFTVEELERLAIRTVEGGMSDADALVAAGLVRRLWVLRTAGSAAHGGNAGSADAKADLGQRSEAR